MKISFLLFLFSLITCPPKESAASLYRHPGNNQVITGAAQMNKYLPLLQGKRVAFLVNQTSVVGNTNLIDTLLKLKVNIVKIFSPEHGFRGNADAGAKVGNSTDPETGLPIISLYGSHHKPTPDELKDVDLMVYDIQDVGTRFYTYISSMQFFLEAAAENHKPMIILDRPDPNGFYIDGPVLQKKFSSGVGLQPIPIVYGMTIGEYAGMLIGEHWLSDPAFQPDLTIIPCLHYTHKSLYRLPVKPSPNLPNMTAVYLYPSLCFFEGTVISLGRGTDKPFQVFGYPDYPKDLFSFTPRSVPGATNPPLLNKLCYGYDLSGIPEKTLQGADHLQLKWLIKAYRLFPDKEKFFNNYFDKLAGNDELKQQIKEGWSEERIRASWQRDLDNFKKIRRKYLLYP